MADNPTINEGSGGASIVVATDDDGTAQHQYVKMEWGPNNTQTPVNTGAAAVPVQDGGNSITVDQATGTNLHTVVDSGTITAVTALTNALPAGTNAIGKLAANSGVDIGDVDVTSLAASFSHKAYTQSLTTALTTELNSLANAALSAASAAIDNTTNLDTEMDLELVLGTQSARTAGAQVSVFIVYAMDGSNYDDVEVTCAQLVAVFSLDAATTARRLSRDSIPIRPGLFKLFVKNSSTQSFAATLNTLSYRTRKRKSV